MARAMIGDEGHGMTIDQLLGPAPPQTAKDLCDHIFCRCHLDQVAVREARALCKFFERLAVFARRVLTWQL